ncbi:MAG: serine/threonine-protein kinase [Nannocystaceae bacterium]
MTSGTDARGRGSEATDATLASTDAPGPDPAGGPEGATGRVGVAPAGLLFPSLDGPDERRMEDLIAARLFPRSAGGQRVGRYTLLDRIGQGGMGVVYSARDPKLDRRVAIKLLQRDDTARRRRMEREAQAMAKLSHPNVVTLYEVGEHEGQLFLAMEFSTGPDLARWLQERGPTVEWRTVLEMFLQAGRGLAAAHRVGLVHRDFKPANVFVGEDGSVRVGDFGIVLRGAAEALRTEPLAGALGDLGSTAEDTLTRTGVTLGTPAYMAPEHFAGGEVDARTDQFAFCVALWEALHGARPFAGSTLSELVSNVTAGRRSPPPASRRAPAWICRALDRGLSVEPGARYPDMEALLTALQADPTRGRRTMAAGAAAAFTLALGLGAHQYRESQQIAGCEAEGASIAAVWDDSARARLREDLLATGAPYAQTTADRVLSYFDDHAAAWQRARADVCLDARVRGLWTEDTLARSVGCLDERRMELEALVAELSRASAASLQNAVDAASQLPRIDPCRDEHRLALAPPLPTERDRVLALRRALAQAAALRAAGEYDKSLKRAQEALAAAEGLGSPPLLAAARLGHGLSLWRLGDYTEAEGALAAAYFQAAEVGAWEVAADAATALISVVGNEQVRLDEGEQWSRHADVALAHFGPDAGLMTADALTNHALVLSSAGAHDEARARHEQALAIRERLLGADHPLVAASLSNIASAVESAGDYAEARARYERALAVRERALGPDHPELGTLLNNLAAVHEVVGDYGEARALNERALAIRERALGPDHPDVATSLDNLGVVYYSTGAYPEARAAFERGLRIREKTLNPGHPDLAFSLNNLGGLYFAMGAYDDARSALERAIAIHEAALGPEHPELATSLDNLASVHRVTGRYAEASALQERALAIAVAAFGPEHATVAIFIHNLAHNHRARGAHDEARALYERAIAVAEGTLGPEHPLVAASLNGLAEVLLAQHRPADALAAAERAVRIGEAGEVPPERLAESRLTLARALWEVAAGPTRERDRARARSLAQQALDALRDGDRVRGEVEAFLADVGGPVSGDRRTSASAGSSPG